MYSFLVPTDVSYITSVKTKLPRVFVHSTQLHMCILVSHAKYTSVAQATGIDGPKNGTGGTGSH